MMPYDEEEWPDETVSIRAVNIPSVREDEELRDHPAVVDWTSLLQNGPRERNWLAGDLFEQGEQIAIVGPGSAGKSLFLVELVHAISLGRPFLGAPERNPAFCLCIDNENGEDDLYDRAYAFGYTADDFKNIKYLSFPEMAPLDTPLGGRQLEQLVDYYGAKVVSLDTVLRMIQGNENDAVTINNLYTYTMKPMKRRGVTVIRLDHTGNDEGDRARGSSAKRQDIDRNFIYTAKRQFPDGRARIELKQNRSRRGRDQTIIITRHAQLVKDEFGHEAWAHGATFHQRENEPEKPALKEITQEISGLTPREQEVLDLIDKAGFAPSVGRPKLVGWAASQGITIGTKSLVNIVKFRKTRGVFTPSRHVLLCTDSNCPGCTEVSSEDSSTFSQRRHVPDSFEDSSEAHKKTVPDSPPPFRGDRQDSFGEVSTEEACIDEWPSIPAPSATDE